MCGVELSRTGGRRAVARFGNRKWACPPAPATPTFDYSVPELTAARSDIREQPRRWENGSAQPPILAETRVAPPTATDTPPAERPAPRRNERPPRPAPEREHPPLQPSEPPQPQQPARDRTFRESPRRTEREFVWDTEIPRTWGDR